MTLSPKELSDRYDLPSEITEVALANIQNGVAKLLTISGKIGSGKDTVAPMILDLLNVDKERRGHDFFAKPLKEEINQVIYYILTSEDIDTASNQISKELNVPLDHAFETTEILWNDVKQGVITTSYDRTPSTRQALQFWGTGVRRAQDDKYWVKKAIRNVLTVVAAGHTVYVTDSRFPNEVESIADSGGVTIRLNVSPEEQARRISDRDGLQISEEARNHVSETSLDDYTGFHVIVNTDSITAHEVAQAVVEKVALHE